MNSIVILAGGTSARLGCDKSLLSLAGKTLIEHVIERVQGTAEETIIALRSKEHEMTYSRRFSKFTLVLDDGPVRGPLAGLWSALKVAKGNRIAVLGSDMPFVSPDLLSLFFELCRGYSAVIPRWPNGYVEPLHSVYNTQSCRVATEGTLRTGRRDMRAMIENLNGILFVSTLTIKEVQPDCSMFTNINTINDLREAERLLASMKPARRRLNTVRRLSQAGRA